MSRRRAMISGLSAVGVLMAGACSRREAPVVDLRRVAAADGTTDDSAAIQRAVSRAPEGVTFRLGGGTYRIGDVALRGGATFVGPGTFVFRSGARHMLAVNAGDGGTPDPRDNVAGLTFDGVGFEGSPRDGFDEYRHLLFLSAVSDVTVRSCTFTAFPGDAIMLASSDTPEAERHNRRVRVARCVFDGGNGQNRNAISVIDVDGLVVEECRFTRCSRPDMPGPIDLEPNVWNVTAVLDAIDIVRNTFVANTGGVGDVVVAVTAPRLGRTLRLRVRGNTFTRDTGIAVALRWVDRFGATDDPPVDIEVEGNDGRRGSIFARLDGVRGVTITGNTVRDYAQAVACGTENGGCSDVDVTDNTFVGVGSPSGAPVAVGTVEDLRVQRNTVTGAPPGSLLRLEAGRTSSRLSVSGNRLPRGVALVERETRHTTAADTNQATDNQGVDADPGVFGRR